MSSLQCRGFSVFQLSPVLLCALPGASGQLSHHSRSVEAGSAGDSEAVYSSIPLNACVCAADYEPA